MKLRTCVSPESRFIYGVHRPTFTVENFRETDELADLGSLPDGRRHRNDANFPPGPVHEPAADWIFEIPNAFPFRGTTYIGKAWADGRAASPELIGLPEAPEISFSEEQSNQADADAAIQQLPRPLQLALAATTTDARDLCCLAHIACTLCVDKKNRQPWGLAYEKRSGGKEKPVITDNELFEAVANNRYLPDAYKQAMILRPGAQGGSEIVGQYGQSSQEGHVFEYLRRNSYIPWGHYAANMANNAMRYRVQDLSLQDMTGMRHLYYQRCYTRLAGLLRLKTVAERRTLTVEELEALRLTILKHLKTIGQVDFDRTLWGWNYGFDYSPSGYRLHASHQQIHQQFALIPRVVSRYGDEEVIPAYGCGDLIGDFVKVFRKETGKGFFNCYQQAILNNQRMDGHPNREHSLVVFEDDQVMVFTPKAQTSQWELQLIPKSPVGNIFEANSAMRDSLNRALLAAVKTLGALGAAMITTIEYSKPLLEYDTDQRLLYAFLPKLPESPGAFSEAQLRWINGHYPEDFALACRSRLPETIGTEVV